MLQDDFENIFKNREKGKSRKIRKYQISNDIHLYHLHSTYSYYGVGVIKTKCMLNFQV